MDLFLQRFPAIQAGERFYQLLQKHLFDMEPGANCSKLVVHSVFDKVLNLSWDDSLLAIVQSGMGNAPGFLVIELPDNLTFRALGVYPEMQAYLRGGSLQIGDLLSIDCSRLREWQGRSKRELCWQGMTLPKENLRACKEAISRWGDKNGAVNLVEHYPRYPFAFALSCLKRAFSENSEFYFNAAVKSMLGYGPGLTPSGDDVLLGFLAAATSGLEYQAQLAKFYQALRLNFRRTTDLSSHMLRQALSGEFHEYLHEVVYAVVRTSPESVIISTKRLLGLGATSGTDIAAGLYLAFYWRTDDSFFQGESEGKGGHNSC